MKKMSLPSRIIIAFASLSLLATLFLPVWFIFLIAPQYPEGLTMQIWLNKITGQVEIINGLNHYIGMKHISADMFPEFNFLTYIVYFFIAFGLVVALTGKRKILFAAIVLTLLGGAAAMYDFYRWGYDYGHNLDPKAAIQVPGLSYQPPLFGHKTLLNFDAYSYPDVGGWIVIAAGALVILVWAYEFRRSKAQKVKLSPSLKNKVALAALVIVTLNSCSVKPTPFQYGKDMCDDCKMTIIEPKFGGEIITKKGKVFKFDDAHCLSHFIHSGSVKEADIAQTVFVDYDNNNHFLDVKSSYFVVSPQLKSPMNSNAAAFVTKEKAAAKATETGGQVKTWDEVFNAQP
ncbi:nitrous oxide reductase accessory protein NosL [Flavisolibacter nicotianae]|uniref:nitrous oxide reductase accessory protein NosL n=1 Tax=Flavisolibacter nicotianae TaxID=2364882 RepID=UPI00196905F6|nr:nitrous oxide reductase accessory protein NosL [Flavisolibacter nicotianae]